MAIFLLCFMIVLMVLVLLCMFQMMSDNETLADFLRQWMMPILILAHLLVLLVCTVWGNK